MRVVFVVHQPDAGSGVFADVLGSHEAVEWRPPGGEPPPARFDVVVTFGGGMNVDQEERHPWLAAEKAWLGEAFEAGKPVLGVCLGSQLLAGVAGAGVSASERPEIGWHEVELTPEAAGDPLFTGLPQRFAALQWHSYRFELPPGATPLARNGVGLQAFRAGERAWGVQFHAEVTADSVASWIERYKGGDDVRKAGADLDAIARETIERIGAWNEFGRTLCARFLEQA